MTFNVERLELESQTVRELLAAILDGMINGNIEIPAVRITDVRVNELKTRANPGRSNLDNTIVIKPVMKASAGTPQSSG